MQNTKTEPWFSLGPITAKEVRSRMADMMRAARRADLERAINGDTMTLWLYSCQRAFKDEFAKFNHDAIAYGRATYHIDEETIAAKIPRAERIFCRLQKLAKARSPSKAT